MKTTYTDYGEPWTLMDTGATHDRNDNLVTDCLAKIRFIACVNACAGFADPAAEIQAMRDGLTTDNNSKVKSCSQRKAG